MAQVKYEKEQIDLGHEEPYWNMVEYKEGQEKTVLATSQFGE